MRALENVWSSKVLPKLSLSWLGSPKRPWSKGMMGACPGVASVLALVSEHSQAAQFLPWHR